jgi:hypothetical protein
MMAGGERNLREKNAHCVILASPAQAGAARVIAFRVVSRLDTFHWLLQVLQGSQGEK